MYKRLIFLLALCLCTAVALAAETLTEPPARPPGSGRILSASQARRAAFEPRAGGMPRATATNSVLYSICPYGTATDYKTGTPTITITHDGDNAVAVLSVEQEGDIGVGMRIDYDSVGTPKKCWIASVRRDEEEDIGDPEDTFYVVTATGGQVPTCSGLTVDSIKHEYASLFAFEAGFTDANHLNDTDFTAEGADARVWACCYKGTDTTGVTLSWGGTQDADHNLIIYTPHESDEVVLGSQRHRGVWTGATRWHKRFLNPNEQQMARLWIRPRKVRGRLAGWVPPTVRSQPPKPIKKPGSALPGLIGIGLAGSLCVAWVWRRGRQP